MASISRVTVILPSLNPDEKLLKTVNGLIEVGFTDIVIINDGSDVSHTENFPDTAEYPQCTVINHWINRGKGAGLKTAFAYVKKTRPECIGVVTVDGDGQHRPEDVRACAMRMLEEDKVILGARNFNLPGIPARSVFGNKMTSFVFKFLCGMKITDTQTGLRAIPIEYLDTLMTVKGDRFEYETNMLLAFKDYDIPYGENSIHTVYIEENKTSHFNPLKDSLRIYKQIFGYAFSSLSATAIDLGAFALFFALLFPKGIENKELCTAVCSVMARVISSFCNYFVNFRFVFAKKKGAKHTLLKYYLLAIGVMIISSLSTAGMTMLLPEAAATGLITVVKAGIDTLLFLLTFTLQREWVFGGKKEKMTKEKAKKQKKESSNGVKLFWLAVRRTLITLLVLLLFLVGSVYALGMTLANGPSESLRDMLVLSAKQASATKWLPGLFLDEETIEQIMANSEKVTVTEIDVDSFKPKPPDGEEVSGEEYDEWADYPDGVRLEYLQGSTYRAYLTVVKDPSRVFVGICDNMGSAAYGMRIFDIAKKYDALAVINAGEFPDNGSSPGNVPLGITYSQGQCVWNDNFHRTFIGIDKNNRLVVSEGMTKAQAEALGIRDGVCFQNGNVLITNENGKVQLHYSEGNVGAAQRTAIGQRADGTMLLVVTDGRSAASIGASRNDIIDLLVSQGAVVAGMLDGGTSSLMYYENYFDRYNIDKSTLDQYQLQGIVNKYKAFIPPRTMPTYFVVAKSDGVE